MYKTETGMRERFDRNEEWTRNEYTKYIDRINKQNSGLRNWSLLSEE